MGGWRHPGIPLLTFTIVVVAASLNGHASPPIASETVPAADTDKVHVNVISQDPQLDRPARFDRKTTTFSNSLVDRFWIAEPLTESLDDFDWMNTQRITLPIISFDLKNSDREDAIPHETNAFILLGSDTDVEFQRALNDVPDVARAT